MASADSGVSGFDAVRSDPGGTDVETPEHDYDDSALAKKHRRRVLHGNNDFIIVIAASSRSAVSGTGKTTLAINEARKHDYSDGGYTARKKGTVNASKFSRDLLTDQTDVPNMSAVIFDESQGTLSGSGIDSRRSMKQSVMDVTTALATLRFRQLTTIIVAQSTDWIDKRIDTLLDALILIQPRSNENEPVRADVYETYYNDFEFNQQRYTEKLCSIRWPPLPEDDPDYQHLHQLKEESAMDEVTEEEDEEDGGLSKDKQIEVAQEMRDQGFTGERIAQSSLIEYGKGWVWKHTEAPSSEE